MNLVLSLLASVWCDPAQACAVCFGKTDQVGLIWGITLGIFALLTFTFSALTGIFLLGRRIERARSAVEAGAEASS
ncbi:MAG: hypothetical protein HY077_00790 [Elusimicrobia bacterium]|nr:hypothetical protein [Elusimicrobiota bacterium]